MNTILNTIPLNKQIAILNQKDTLLLAIGNSARSDDGLAWAFLDQLKALNYFRGKTNYCYQLQIEDAEMISRYPRVIFVDACEGKHCNGFTWEATDALNDFSFTTHALTPGAVLYLCQELYQKTPEAFTLKIKGHDWELKTGLSNQAKESLTKALVFFEEMMTTELCRPL